MKKIIFRIAAVFAILLAGCVAQQQITKDCGNDLACFEEIAKECKPAKFVNTDEFGNLAIEIKGMKEDGICDAYFKLEKLPENSNFKEWQGFDMNCSLTPEEVIGEKEMNLNECQGQLADALKLIQ